MRPRTRLLALSLAALVGARDARAQTGRASATCFGFAFGRWHPALDLAAAGHDTVRRDSPQAPEGRGWAIDDAGGSRDSVRELMLFPPWWPAGLAIRPVRTPAVGDTVKATAVALVANGLATAPRAQALVWGVPCGRAPQSAPAWSTPGDSSTARPSTAPPATPARRARYRRRP